MINGKKIDIWCTLGPASMNRKVIQRLEESGVTMFRINLSHTKAADIKDKVLEIRQHTTVPVCLDTEGPQIRTGVFKDGQVFLKENEVVKIVNEETIGTADIIPLRPKSVVETLQVGDLFSIDFDSALLSIIKVGDHEIQAKVICEGTVGSNKAVTADRLFEMPVLSEKDLHGVKVIKELGLKDISISFVNRSTDVEYVRKLVGEHVRIISKIETNMALVNLDAILKKTDAILIDRGDLSREEPINKIPLLQKEIIRKANAVGKEVVVATNFLESMVKTKKPLRSEVNDIMTTLMDGADGLVLAAETAIGQYPAECGNMVKRMIKYFEISQGEYSLEKLLQNDSFLLVEPHGGTLIDCYDKDTDFTSIEQLPKLEIDELGVLDAEQIGIGAYSPLDGFLTQEQCLSVLDRYKLPNGVVWPMPIILQVSEKKYKQLKSGMQVALVFDQDKKIYATMDIKDAYELNLEETAVKWFGTKDTSHPGVARLFLKGKYCIGGRIILVRRKESPFKEYEFTPKQMRLIFEHKEWSKVAGFHTRNAIHRVHEYLQATTIERYNLDGLLLHPVIGPKKTLDFQPDIILSSYKIMMDKYYPKNKYVFGAFSGYSHYAGPREAVFTALCRKNFGCSHFIMGRDHTGVKDFYTASQAKDLFNYLGDIGIQPVFFNAVYYCLRCGSYVESCEHDEKDFLHISGTQARELFLSGQKPPAWLIREEISEMIFDKLQDGEEVFVA